MEVHRGEVFYADLSPVVGSEQGGIRPVLIIQNEIGNRHSPTVIAAAITSRQDKNRLPTHISVRADRCGLAKDSIILTEQIRTLDKRRLRERAGVIPPDDMRRVDEALGGLYGAGKSGCAYEYRVFLSSCFVGAGHARPAALPMPPFNGRFVGRGLDPSAGRRGRRPLQRQSSKLLIAASGHGGQRAGRPTIPFNCCT